MPLVRVGYRRLYDAIGCSLGDDQRELSFTFSFSPDLDVAIYLGPKPTFGINICRSDKYLVPGEESTLLKGEYYRDASKSNYPRNVFVEIFVSKYVEVSEGTMIALHVRDQQTQNELLKLAEKDADTVCRTADLVAGIIGLRFHRQFVIEVLNENFVAFYSDKDFVHKVEGPPVEVLNKILLNPTGIQAFGVVLSEIGKIPDEARDFASSVLKWLLRAWAEHNPTMKFVALFIPLEIILNRYTAGPQIKLRQMAGKLRRLIHNHGGEERKALLEFFNRLVERQKPSIVSRFQALAQEANMAGYEQDIEAFKQFNKLRTRLLHEGEEEIPLAISVTPEEVCHFEDLVERYVNYILFRDQLVYPSRHRLRRFQEGEIPNGE